MNPEERCIDSIKDLDQAHLVQLRLLPESRRLAFLAIVEERKLSISAELDSLAAAPSFVTWWSKLLSEQWQKHVGDEIIVNLSPREVELAVAEGLIVLKGKT